MKIRIACVGRLKEHYFKAAEAEYRKRLRPHCNLEITEARDDKSLLASLPASAHVYALDERGDQLTSAQFADVIAREQQHGGGAEVIFAIGGPDGHSDALRKRASRLIAFGRATIAHRLVRLVLLEQVYRAHKIIRNEPYHR